MPVNAATNALRQKYYRDRLRAAGLRPIQLWVPDSRAPGFAEECRRQSATLANDVAETNAADFIEAAGNQIACR